MILLSIAQQLKDRLAALERIANNYQTLMQLLNQSTLGGGLPAGASFSLSLSLPGEDAHTVAVGSDALPQELYSQLLHDAAARASHQVVALWREITAIAGTGWEHCQTVVAATQAGDAVAVAPAPAPDPAPTPIRTGEDAAAPAALAEWAATLPVQPPQSPGLLQRSPRVRIASPQVAPAPTMPVVGVGATPTATAGVIHSRFGRTNPAVLVPTPQT
jgi:hypothetical protein